ncbi:MAG: hypothetical protein ACOX1H_05545 [Pseudoramibacter sp.]
MPDMDLNRVQDIVMHDKKFTGDILNVCVMPRIGTAEIVRVQKDKAIDLFTPDAVESEMPAPLDRRTGLSQAHRWTSRYNPTQSAGRCRCRRPKASAIGR